MPTTLLVDGNSVAYTININNCKDEKDFCKQFFFRLREYAKQFTNLPKAILFFDDKFGGNWRELMYPDYQKGRREAVNKYTEVQKDEQEKRRKCLTFLKNKLDNSSKFTYLHYPKTETDDLLALYCNNIQENNETVVILTTDKDLFQLIREKGNKKVQVLFLIKRKLIKDESMGKEILENKIWLGDPSDSIPGVCKNVGERSLKDLQNFLKKVKDLENFDITDINKTKKICEKLDIKYIPSFSNFDIEQYKLNQKLIDLSYVVLKDKEEGDVKTEYLKNNVNKAKVSPYSLYSFIS